MNSSTEDSIFTARLDDVGILCKILNELHHGQDHSIFVIDDRGIKLITASEKTFQISAYFDRNIFERFEYQSVDQSEDQVSFRFIFKDFIECLNLLRDDPLNADGDVHTQSRSLTTSLYIQYKNKGDKLKFRLENKSNYVINCDLRAFTLPDTMFQMLTFSEDEEAADILLNSRKFHDYVSGLDFEKSEYVHLVMSRDDVPIKLSTRSNLLGEVELEITQDQKDIIVREIAVSDNCVYSFSYRTKFIKPALEALRNSSRVQIKCGSRGLLCIEHFHQVDSVEGEQPSVEYFILSEYQPSDE